MENNTSNSDIENIEIGLGIQYISSFKRINYQPWYALAEFIDNSTQSYFDNKNLLDSIFKQSGEGLEVSINYDSRAGSIVIKDNSIGMSQDELKKAIFIGNPKENAGRSKYGIGMKAAACWFGNFWTVETKKYDETQVTKIEVDVNRIINENVIILPTKIFEDKKENHYTIITITQLNRKLRGNTLKKIKEFLSSFYRIDFEKSGLILKWQWDTLSWEGFEKKFYITSNNKPYKKYFNFEIGEPLKKVTGWVGVLGIGSGSRDYAGFSVIQNNRVIQGCPDAYKPSKLFGNQETGTNNLVNQRLVGELYVDGFAVSHTKDKIDWEDYEDDLEDKLFEECREAKSFAQTLRTSKSDSLDLSEQYRSEAISAFESELKSDELRDKIFLEEVPNERTLDLSYKKIINTVISNDEPNLTVTVGENYDTITVSVYFRRISEFEPYVLIETTMDDNSIIVILNVLHPYWLELKNSDGFLTYIRHSVYDGLAEWKTRRKTGRVNPDTIKYIKDSFMRVAYEIITNKIESQDR